MFVPGSSGGADNSSWFFFFFTQLRLGSTDFPAFEIHCAAVPFLMVWCCMLPLQGRGGGTTGETRLSQQSKILPACSSLVTRGLDGSYYSSIIHSEERCRRG